MAATKNKQDKTVLIYTTPWCVFCKNVKEYLDEKGVGYELIDVQADPTKAQEMIDKSGQMGVPVTDIDGQIVVGFDKSKLDDIFATAK